MEQRLANTWRMTVNEKKFIESALLSGLRTDGRNLYDFRKLAIELGREDGWSDVCLGQTRVIGVVTGQLVQPYRDRPNEGSLSIFTEFSPMADPSFEPGRPGESAVELGRVIDRGLRESRAVDTESLCVLAGKLVWAIRVDLHILDNGGNLVDAANIAALVALSTFRRPECSLGGEDGQKVIVHPPEAREPIPLTIHHLPIAVTFAFLSNESIVILDPTYHEEAVMGGRMTVTLNTNGDICAIQKAGGEGVPQSVIMQCLRIANTKAADITSKIKVAVEKYNTERDLRKIKRHSVPYVNEDADKVIGKNIPLNGKGSDDISGVQIPQSKLKSKENNPHQSDIVGGNTGMGSSARGGITSTGGNTKNFIGGPSSWDPYSKGIDPNLLKSSLASRVRSKKQEDLREEKHLISEAKPEVPSSDINLASSVIESKSAPPNNREKTLKDAVKPKSKRKKRGSSSVD